MPPVTTQSRVFYNNSLKSSNQGKDKVVEDSHPSPRKRRPRNNSKSYSKNVQKKTIKKSNENEKIGECNIL